ncbi:MAG: ribose-phosphate diphosphokinase [Candidatus Woesearchaeota archaeon]
MKKIILAFPYSKELGKKLAVRLNAEFSVVDIKYFPDREKLVQIKADVKNKKAIVVNSLYEPDEKIIDLCLTAATLKDLGARQITLVAPYLGYMRQDKRFHKGESISSKIIAKIITPFFSKLITIDPHLHRYKSLNTIYKLKTKVLTANSLVADYIKKYYNDVIIIGPDEESYQWAANVAKAVGVKVTVAKKTRLSSRKVMIELKDKIKLRGKTVVIVDDIISTGHTMIEVVKNIKKQKPKMVVCIGVHGLFVENAYKKLKDIGVDKIVTTNCIPHKTNDIDVSPILKKYC